MAGDLNLDAAVASALTTLEESDELFADDAAHAQKADALNPRYLEGIGRTFLPTIARRMIMAALPHILEASAQKIESFAQKMTTKEGRILILCCTSPQDTLAMAAAIVRGAGETHPETAPDSREARQDASGVAPETPDVPEAPEGAGDLPASDRHGWTNHGHPCCREAKLRKADRPAVSRCGGPGMCKKCQADTQRIHSRPSCLGGQ